MVYFVRPDLNQDKMASTVMKHLLSRWKQKKEE